MIETPSKYEEGKAKKMRKRMISLCLCVSVCMGSLTACGGAQDATTGTDGTVSGSAIRGSAVSGGAVSASAISEEVTEDTKRATTKVEDHRYCSTTNIYTESGDEPGDVAQMRLDGTHIKGFKLPDFSELLYVEASALYYSAEVWDEEGNEVLSSHVRRVPLQKDDAGFDVLQLENIEEVVSWDGLGIYNNTCMNEQYIVCEVGTEYSSHIEKYDWKNKKHLPAAESLPDSGEISRIYLCEDCVIVESERVGMYIQSMDDTKWNCVMAEMGEDHFECLASWDEEAFYSVAGGGTPNEVYRIDLKEQLGSEFISKKEIKEAAIRAKALDTNQDKVDVCGIVGMFCAQGRLYIQIQLSCRWGKKYTVGYVMFSKGEKDEKLRYEEFLTNLLWNSRTMRKGRWIEGVPAGNKPAYEEVIEKHVTLYQGRCLWMLDSKAFLGVYDNEKEKIRLVYYDLNTDDYKWITKKDKEYYEYYYELPHSRYDGNMATWSLYGRRIWGFENIQDQSYCYEELIWGPNGWPTKRGRFDETSN